MSSEFRPYQLEALQALRTTKGVAKSLIMPTGSGKTRVALKYAAGRLEMGSVAYIVETDAHVSQVLAEAKRISVEAVFIPGKNSTTATREDLEQRDARLQDYSLGLVVGIFSYAGYFSGSQVGSAETLIVDDAHALATQPYSYSVIEVDQATFETTYRQILKLLKEKNKLLADQFDQLSRPVHRGGPALLIPPSRDAKLDQAIVDLVKGAASGSGYGAFLLRERLAQASYFIHWPLVVTAGALTWRPFVLPFASVGQSPSDRAPEKEIILTTATRGTENFLRLRLGLPIPVGEATFSAEVPEMGTRLVMLHETLKDNSPPSQAQANVIRAWAKAVGSIVITVSSDQADDALKEELGNEIALMRYVNNDSLAKFERLEQPRALILVNRPSGIDVSAKLCPVAIHLDLPYSASGHEVVAGDVERSGTISEASLAVRLSQLLGRLNRSPDDRSVHLLLAGPLPLQPRSVFVRSLDPAVLTDIILGQRGFVQKYGLPHSEALIEEAKRFLRGDDSVRNAHLEDATKRRDRYLKGDASEWAPPADALIEANLMMARGNFPQAAKRFQHFGIEAASQDANGLAAFYDIQFLSAGFATGGMDEEVFGPGGWKAVASTALSRNPGSGILIGALKQLKAESTDSEGLEREMVSLRLKSQAFHFYDKWFAQHETLLAPLGADIAPWKEHWRRRLGALDHDKLLDAYIEGVQLLGSDTPERELKSNDARVAWSDVHGERTLALEVKGRQSSQGKEETLLKAADVAQARTNAEKITAQHVLLATSKFKQDKDVEAEAKNRGVSYLVSEAATALADAIARQCVTLEGVRTRKVLHTEAPYDMTDFRTLIHEAGGEITSDAVRKAFPG